MRAENARAQAVVDPANFGPFAAVTQAYLSEPPGLGRLMSGSMPNAILKMATAPLKGLARIQLEITGFAIRRAQAYMTLPSELARCRTPRDLVSLQVDYWCRAAEQFAERAERVAAVYGTLVPGAAASIAPFPKARLKPTHDYISFDEAEERDWRQKQEDARIGETRRVA